MPSQLKELLPDLCFPSVALGKSTRQDSLGILRASLMPKVRIAEHKGAGPGVREALDAGTVRARSRALFLADIGQLCTITKRLDPELLQSPKPLAKSRR